MQTKKNIYAKKKKLCKKVDICHKNRKKNRKYEKQAYFLHNYVKIVPK